jgi:hypothetical protein
LLLNDPWVREQSQALVARLRAEAGSDSNAMIRRLWLLAYQRAPSPDEREIALQFIEEQDPRDEQETWISLCRAVLNSNEFLYVD